MKWIKNHKIAFLVALLGAAGGFLYWYFIGCTSGTCNITANCYTSVGYGTLMGWLIGDFASDKFKTKAD
ncbi:MAG: DUF6132 family protein [Flavobacteriales bacterium]